MYYFLLMMLMQKIPKKHTFFSLLIFPKDKNKIDWQKLKKQEVEEELVKLNFLKVQELARILFKLKIKGDKLRRKKSCYYFSSLRNFGGQLEYNSSSSRPSYRLWVEMVPKQTTKRVREYFSQAIYQELKSEYIVVRPLPNTPSFQKNYNREADRANFSGIYKHVDITPMYLIPMIFSENCGDEKRQDIIYESQIIEYYKNYNNSFS